MPLKEIDLNVTPVESSEVSDKKQTKAQKFELPIGNLKLTSVTGDSKIPESNVASMEQLDASEQEDLLSSLVI